MAKKKSLKESKPKNEDALGLCRTALEGLRLDRLDGPERDRVQAALDALNNG